jgi:hypothetical protein
VQKENRHYSRQDCKSRIFIHSQNRCDEHEGAVNIIRLKIHPGRLEGMLASPSMAFRAKCAALGYTGQQLVSERLENSSPRHRVHFSHSQNSPWTCVCNDAMKRAHARTPHGLDVFPCTIFTHTFGAKTVTQQIGNREVVLGSWFLVLGSWFLVS